MYCRIYLTLNSPSCAKFHPKMVPISNYVTFCDVVLRSHNKTALIIRSNFCLKVKQVLYLINNI